jgi:hypothetical protein
MDSRRSNTMSGRLNAAESREGWEWFLERAAEVRASPSFETERDERLELAAGLCRLLDAAREGANLRPALDPLLHSLSGTPWKTQLAGWVETWASSDAASLRQALLAFVDQQERSAEDRFDRFAEVVRQARKAHATEPRPTIALLWGSLLNFAVEPESLPVIRPGVFWQLERALGYDTKRGRRVGEQYENHLAFARSLRSELVRALIPVRDMIDVELCASHSLREPLDAVLPPLPRAEAIPETVQSLKDSEWMMTFGERAALEGLLSQVGPTLALEIGAGLGGSLRRLAAHSDEVHEIDLADPPSYARELANVHWHKGDSHVLLPQLLARFAEEGRNVDFALIDGDHTAEGARRDMEDLLSSPATGRTFILAHDTMNESVRSGLEQVAYERIPKVAYVDLDFVPGCMFRAPIWRYQLWGGLGLIVVDAGSSGTTLRQDRCYEAHSLMLEAKQLMTAEGNA